jgi:CDP-2,3-bis-(O-geranylgeranyl)-sn-glycerol synthase
MLISAVYYRYWEMHISPEFLLIPLLSAFWIMMPAYVPNPVAAFLGGGRPIDGGRTYRDGRRIFGDGKTWRGFIAGVVSGVVIGGLMILAQQALGITWLPNLTFPVVFLLAFGALAGDLVKSFFKRRLGKEQGAEWLIADQYDLVIGPLVLLLIFEYAWVMTYLTPLVIFWIIVITPILHRAVNIIGYITGIKDVPW